MGENALSTPIGSATTKSDHLLVVDGVEKTYRTLGDSSVNALASTHLAIEREEFVGIVGPSGCGKTTLLNIVAGLIRPTVGEIRFQGRPIDGPSREIGMIFQRPVLLPWKRIIDNVMLPAIVMGLKPRETFRRRALAMLEMVGLQGFESAYPRELSGGMQQRAAIARALVCDSNLLLMDEPFAALDAMTRRKMQDELLHLWEDTGFSVLFVTHSIEEAIIVGSRILLLTPHPGQVKAELNASHHTHLDVGRQGFVELQDRIHALLFNEPEAPGDSHHG